ncbi:hypothetical protein THICB1_30374 [Thiomonas arsenitoxydans]|uniref:Uncharacterized protein n=1 Tax=Thiomonas arsenitoxydans (strain DSM 22701 / CIP 110005 / 3As) TaxID=426114 RepID=A0ABM9T7S6_THIA3|nr:hypothetical protein THICB1_30374 [Thiomonas arsenitoxydans]CQR40545.1 hypothetical protein THICB6_80377 [Thiomonas arsenitoxydans]
MRSNASSTGKHPRFTMHYSSPLHKYLRRL